MAQIEIVCRELVFHFNKKHLEDPTIPMWVVKTKGESYYVNHVDCQVAWSTKETPDNNHTKGSIKVKNCLFAIDEENCAIITQVTASDILRIKKKNSIRLITAYSDKLKQALGSIKHGPIKRFYGSCSSEFFMVDLFNKDDYSMLLLAWPGKPYEIRILMPNEDYYKLYDASTQNSINIDEDDWEELYES